MFFAQEVADCAPIVTASSTGGIASFPNDPNGTAYTSDSLLPTVVAVQFVDSDGAYVDTAFHLIVVC